MGQQRNYNSDLKYADLDLVIERRVGFEPTVTIRCKQTFGPTRWQLRCLTAACKEDGNDDSTNAHSVRALASGSKTSLGPSSCIVWVQS